MTTTDMPEFKPNGADAPTVPPETAAKVEKTVNLAKKLLLPNPASLLATAEQVVVPVVKAPGPLEFFRTHPSIRLCVPMVTPAKGTIGADTYAVMPEAIGLLAQYNFHPKVVTLFPIVVASNPPSFKLVMVTTPSDGRKWDAWSLSRKQVLDIGVERWIAMRPVSGGYGVGYPDPGAKFPEPAFPDWDDDEWLQRSLAAADLVIYDGSHEIFKEIRHL